MNHGAAIIENGLHGCVVNHPAIGALAQGHQGLPLIVIEDCARWPGRHAQDVQDPCEVVGQTTPAPGRPRVLRPPQQEGALSPPARDGPQGRLN